MKLLWTSVLSACVLTSAQSDSAGMPSVGQSRSSPASSRISSRYGTFSNIAELLPRTWKAARLARVGGLVIETVPPEGSKAR